MEAQDIPIDLLEDNPYEIRKKYGDIEGLALSIKERGLQNPISVVKVENRFIIVHGHRRTHAFRYLKRKTIPGIIRKESTPTDLIIDLAIENLQRKDLTPAEKGTTIEQLLFTIPNVQNNPNRVQTLLNQIKSYGVRDNIGEGFTEEDIIEAKRLLYLVNISATQAIVYVRLNTLPEDIRDNVVLGDNATIPEGKIPIKSAYEMTRIDDQELQKDLYQKAIKDKMTHVEIKTVVDKLIDNNAIVAKKSRRGSVKRKTEDDVGAAKLTDELMVLSSRVASFRSKIPFVCERLEKVEWAASLNKMKKACLDMVKNINDVLQEDMTSEGLLEYVNADLEINITNDMKYRFPKKIADVLKVKEGDTLLLKVEGITYSVPKGAEASSPKLDEIVDTTNQNVQ